MMKIEFTTGGEAFRNVFTGEESEMDEAKECIRILRRINVQLEHGYREGACFDLNGNKVGEWTLE